MWKDVRINVASKEVTEQPYKEEYRLVGGRSLVARFLTDEVPADCDPVGEQNKLIFCTGLFAGTNLSTAHRMNVGGKSPLTGGIKESNVGGTVGHLLAGHGIKMMVLEGIPAEDAEYSLLIIDTEGNIRFQSAEGYVGLNNYAVVEKAKEEFGDRVGIASIGRSGEFGYKNSGIAVTEQGESHPCRLAARGGLGSVMGSKKIKAIIVERPAKRFVPEFVDRERFDKALKEFTAKLVEGSKTSFFTNVGTAAIAAMTAPSGMLPVRNFSGEFFDEHEKIGPTQFLADLEANGGRNKVACQPGCIVRCSNNYHGKDGEFITGGLEYETIGLCGSNLDIADLESIAKIDRRCDDMGIDTIDAGATLGICMEGGKIPWGDLDACLELLDEMNENTEFGKIMGAGTVPTGKHLGVDRVPSVKNQALAAYDPRTLKGTGLTYATSSMGADHSCGTTFGWPIESDDNPGNIAGSRQAQLASLSDSSMCMFTWTTAGAKNIDLISEMMQGMYGVPMEKEDIVELNTNMIVLEKAFNTRAGLKKEDDRLPEFFYTQPSAVTGDVVNYTQEEYLEVFNFYDYDKAERKL